MFLLNKPSCLLPPEPTLGTPASPPLLIAEEKSPFLIPSHRSKSQPSFKAGTGPAEVLYVNPDLWSMLPSLFTVLSCLRGAEGRVQLRLWAVGWSEESSHPSVSFPPLSELCTGKLGKVDRLYEWSWPHRDPLLLVFMPLYNTPIPIEVGPVKCF